MTTTEGRILKSATQAAPAGPPVGIRLWKDRAAEPGDTADGPAPEEAAAEPGEAPSRGGRSFLYRTDIEFGPGPAPVAETPAVAPPPAPPPVEAVPVEPAPEADEPTPPVAIAQDDLPDHASPFPQRARDNRRRNSNILGYWARIKGDRPMPAWHDLDKNQIAFFWPNSFLLACDPRSSRGKPVISRATRIADNDGMADRGADIAFTAPMVAWILKLSAAVVGEARPLTDNHVFKTEDGQVLDCHLIALPLSGTDGQVDHVLCHVKRN